MTELQPWAVSKPVCNLAGHGSSTKASTTSISKLPSAITLVRNRLFYARPAMNAKGSIRFRLRHIREQFASWLEFRDAYCD